MALQDINLLPEQAIEALQHDKLRKQKLYYLIAIVVSLLVVTMLSVFVYHAYVQTVEAEQELLAEQEARLENLNPLWNEIIQLNTGVQMIPPARAQITQLRKTLEVVTTGLEGLTLLQFNYPGEGIYELDIQALNKEESKRYVQYLQESLPTARVAQVESIRELNEIIYFTVRIEY